MEPILLFSKQSSLVTTISNTFIDEYMPSANGSFVKVYLYLAMCMQAGEQALSLSSLADRLNNTEADIMRALHYWENKKLIQISYSKSTGEPVSITLLDPVPAGNSGQTAVAAPSTANYLYDKPLNEPIHLSDYMFSDMHGTSEPDTTPDMHNVPVLHAAHASDRDIMPFQKTGQMPQADSQHAQSMRHMAPTSDSQPVQSIRHMAPSSDSQPAQNMRHMAPVSDSQPAQSIQQMVSVSDEQAETLAADAEFTWTSHVIESYLNRPLNPNEVQLISYLYGTLGFSSDLLLYLYEYCISLGKTNPNYIQAVAFSWDEKQVHTPEDAKSASAGYNSTYTAVSKAFALGRTLASIEKKYVDKWQNDWGMDLSVILEACNRTMLKISKADFKYAEGILDNWHKAAIHTIQDVEKADEVYARQKSKRQADGRGQSGNRNRNQFQAFAQRSTTQSDVEALERKLLMH